MKTLKTLKTEKLKTQNELKEAVNYKRKARVKRHELLEQKSRDPHAFRISGDDSDQDSVLTPQKRKRSRLSVSPSPARSNRSSAHSRKRTRPSRPFPSNISADRWHNSDEPDVEPAQPVFRPIRTPGPQLLSMTSYSPLQFFELFFSTSVMQKIVAHTNAYGSQKRRAGKMKWQNISIKNLKLFLALVIYMGFLKCFNLTDYWRTSHLYSLPYPARIMSFKKFMSISNTLHLSDPTEDAENEKKKGTAAYDRLCKIKPLYQHIRDACKSCFQPSQNISIDERMVASKARNGLKQYMKNKPTKWGYKLFVLADSLSGYTWDFFVYEGKLLSKQKRSISYESVMTLANEKLLGSGYKLYVDNFYTSPTLFRDLLRKKIWACGTVQASRIGHSKKAAPRGNIRWFRDDKLLFVEWKDRRDVLMCSTFHKAFNGDTVKRRMKGADGVWTFKDISVPAAVLDYNKYMGGVDLSDALISYYTVLHKTRKWYRSFFYHFVDIAVVNAFILHKQMAGAKQQKPLTQKAFREALVSQLAGTGPLYSSKAVPPSSSEHLHLPKYISGDSTAGRRKCRMCKLKTPVMCEMCDVALCLIPSRECYTDWHETNS